MDGRALRIYVRSASTVPQGVAAAMARMNGRCQITSPMPGFTWMTAVGFTLIARQKVAIWHL
jgi:hypothetical protein